MPHVQFSSGNGAISLKVDGVEMSDKILAAGFRIDPPNSADDSGRVRMTVMADVLDVDLPDCVVEATREVSA